MQPLNMTKTTTADRWNQQPEKQVDTNNMAWAATKTSHKNQQMKKMILNTSHETVNII